MTLLRFILHATAVLTGAYSLLTWTLGLLTDAGIAGAISAAAVVAAEGIRYCGRQREQMREYREAVWLRRDQEAWTYGAAGPEIYPTWELTASGSWTLPEEHRPVWPNEIGAIE